MLQGGPTINPFFLVGCPRSGTTLLQRILDAHPDVSVLPETHFIRRFWLERNQYGSLDVDANIERLIDEIVALPEFADMHIQAEAYRSRIMGGPRTFANLLGALMELLAQRTGARMVGEKTPNHLLYMRELQSLFPGARFIHLVRDPRAVVNSWRDVPWSTGSVAGDAAVWRRYVEAARRKPPNGSGSLFQICYEELVTNPERIIDSVCQFIGIPFHASMLAATADPGHLFDASREPWKANAVDGVSETSLEKWRSVLSEAEVADIERIVWPEMTRWGYAPQASPVSLALRGPFSRLSEWLHRRMTGLARTS